MFKSLARAAGFLAYFFITLEMLFMVTPFALLELYTSGLGDFLAVLDAQRQLYVNENLLAQSQTVVTTNLIALYKALGGGWESFPQQ